MAEGSALDLYRGHATICLPIEKDEYDAIVENPKGFRQWLDRCYAEMPELFPQGFSGGYAMKDGRTSVKLGESLRRIVLRQGRSYSIRPSFLMPYMTARTEEVEGPVVLAQVRRAVLGSGTGLRPGPHVLVSLGDGARTQQPRGHHRTHCRVARTLAGR